MKVNNAIAVFHLPPAMPPPKVTKVIDPAVFFAVTFPVSGSAEPGRGSYKGDESE